MSLRVATNKSSMVLIDITDSWRWGRQLLCTTCPLVSRSASAAIFQRTPVGSLKLADRDPSVTRMVGGNIGATTTSGSSTSTFRCIESIRAWRRSSESLRGSLALSAATAAASGSKSSNPTKPLDTHRLSRTGESVRRSRPSFIFLFSNHSFCRAHLAPALYDGVTP